jgi:hypothetical protein
MEAIVLALVLLVSVATAIATVCTERCNAAIRRQLADIQTDLERPLV